MSSCRPGGQDLHQGPADNVLGGSLFVMHGRFRTGGEAAALEGDPGVLAYRLTGQDEVMLRGRRALAAVLGEVPGGGTVENVLKACALGGLTTPKIICTLWSPRQRAVV